MAGWLIYRIDYISNFVKISPKKNGVRQDPVFPKHPIDRPPLWRRFRRVVHSRDTRLDNRAAGNVKHYRFGAEPSIE